jgi:hypothetical protein
MMDAASFCTKWGYIGWFSIKASWTAGQLESKKLGDLLLR